MVLADSDSRTRSYSTSIPASDLRGLKRKGAISGANRARERFVKVAHGRTARSFFCGRTANVGFNLPMRSFFKRDTRIATVHAGSERASEARLSIEAFLFTRRFIHHAADRRAIIRNRKILSNLPTDNRRERFNGFSLLHRWNSPS